MKRISFNLSKRQWILLFSSLLCILLALGLHWVSSLLKGSLLHEDIANQWDKEGGTAHISVYLSESEKHTMKANLESTVFELTSNYHAILSELESASIGVGEEAPPTNARQVVYGYSAAGNIAMETERGRADVKAYGVGGDFFLFHPLKLVSGSYFSESDLMQDRVLLDTETAWRLFGSSDIVGMFVKIGGIPHLVCGVYEKESGYFNDAAGNDESCVYVSHSTLHKLGQYHGLETIEYLVPNPVSGFGLDLVKKQYSSRDVAFVEHQERFSFMPLIKILGAFGTRSMGLSGITFPYWENIARGYEDILADLLLVELIFFAYAAIVIIANLWLMWIRRKWRMRYVYEGARDFVYALRVRSHNKRKQHKQKALQKKTVKSSEMQTETTDELEINTDF